LSTLLDDLIDALSHHRGTFREHKAVKSLANRLVLTFEPTIRAFKSDTAQSPSRRARAQKHRDAARRIVYAIKKFTGVLDDLTPQIREAVSRRYLEWRTPEATDGPVPLADMVGGSAAVSETRTSLTRLEKDCCRWELMAMREGELRRGRPSARDRVILAEWIALRLTSVGVKLAKSDDGTFVRVLRAVYDHAGVSTYSVFHDVRQVLEDHDLQPYLNYRPRKVQKSTPKKRNSAV
jgi:hypothetical protein